MCEVFFCPDFKVRAFFYFLFIYFYDKINRGSSIQKTYKGKTKGMFSHRIFLSEKSVVKSEVITYSGGFRYFF